MLTNKEIYEIADRLNMTGEGDRCCCADMDEPYTTMSKDFQNHSNDIVYVTNFVNDLMLGNDTDRVKQFLVCLLMKNGENNDKNN